VSWLALVTLTYPLSEFAVRLRPFDILALVMIALVLIAALGRGSVIKGLVSGLLGILVSMPGTDPSAGYVRLTFGYHDLDGGFSTLAVLIGAFAVAQVLSDVVDIERKVEKIETSARGMWISLREWRPQTWNLIRSSLIGTWVGIMPGIGATVGSLVAYTVAKTVSRTPEKFGTGHPAGIVASECGNNATVGGALVPLIAMGIPGSVTDVFLLAALVIHGLQPGPLLFNEHPGVVYIIFASCLISHFVLFIIMTAGIRGLIRLMTVPVWYLFPVILIFCLIGAFADNNRAFDVFVMLGFAVVGLVMEKMGYSLGAFVIGFVLGPITEKSLRAGLTLSDGSYLDIFMHPVSGVCMALSAGMFLWSLYSQARLNRLEEAAQPAEDGG
jgi:putative tricarboxylic transport membrane protein